MVGRAVVLLKPLLQLFVPKEFMFCSILCVLCLILEKEVCNFKTQIQDQSSAVVFLILQHPL